MTVEISAGAPGEQERGDLLLVEDNPGDARLVTRYLTRRSDFQVHHVRRLAEAKSALSSREFSVVLLDLSLPDGFGLETVKEVSGAAPLAPIVVLSGAEDPAVAVEALQAGAQDFLTKGGIDGEGLLRSLRFAIERKRSEGRIAWLAHHDPLTGLVNRACLKDRVALAQARAARGGRRMGVLFLDLDRFKQINDTLGHEMGDRLLVEVAERLRSCVRNFETVARLGGDEFVVVLEDLAHPSEAEGVAARIVNTMKRPFLLGDQEQQVSTSIGIALGEFDDTVEALLDRADAAMYRVKRGGRAAYTLGAHLPVDLERILVPGEMELMFQPKLDLDLGRVTGAEALLRWRELPPAELVPALEARGLMSAVGERVLRAALLEGHRWGRSSEFRIAVNLSSEQFDREGLPEEIEAIVAETGLPPDHLELEVTEDVILRDVNRSQGVLDRLRGIGARISLDDFSARSSLTDLARFPLDIIKLDRSLISGLAEAPAQRAIVAAVVNLARNLGIETVGEGVETFEEQASLRRLGVDAVQGFLLLGPMDPKGLTVWLADRDAAKG